jgi:hypothetical protein
MRFGLAVYQLTIESAAVVFIFATMPCLVMKVFGSLCSDTVTSLSP